MKRFDTYMWMFLVIPLLMSCSKDDADVADPVGTVTQSINYTVGGMSIILYQGVEADPGQTWPYVLVKVGIRDASMNFSFDAITSLDYDIIQYLYIGHQIGGEIVDIGEVNGLGNVTEKPVAGWSGLAAVQDGHGYVVRYKYTFNYNSSVLPYMYGRLYVDGFITNAYNEIIGARVKYQNPF